MKILYSDKVNIPFCYIIIPTGKYLARVLMVWSYYYFNNNWFHIGIHRQMTNRAVDIHTNFADNTHNLGKQT